MGALVEVLLALGDFDRSMLGVGSIFSNSTPVSFLTASA